MRIPRLGSNGRLALLFAIGVAGVSMQGEADPQRRQRHVDTPDLGWPGLGWPAPSPAQPLLGHQDPARALSFDPLDELRHALDVMQTTWYSLSLGTWPSAIDWTAAVTGTHVLASLGSFSKAMDGGVAADEALPGLENELNQYFAQNIAFYFGQDDFSIRFQAYDDMLWVVLGWLEGVKSIKLHSRLHYEPVSPHGKQWYGVQFANTFGHRARVFYELAAEGWDTTLCGGGMVWSPRLSPYKNAITNELFIAASVGMYLYFPGDENTSPFAMRGVQGEELKPAKPHDVSYLRAAIDGYDWLATAGMRNAHGLYADGFHVKNWKTNGTVCNIRNEQVFTYNQGVVLSGLRGLWESTGNATYLVDGHELVRNVIRATGWDYDSQKPFESTDWAGMGRAGIMEEVCDASAKCDQTPQTFKSIFYHHLALFCEPLPFEPLVPGVTYVATKGLALLHYQSCREYGPWTAYNAKAALGTRDDKGRFGTWWGVKAGRTDAVPSEEGAIDYRNNASKLLEDLWLPREPVQEADRQLLPSDPSILFSDSLTVNGKDTSQPDDLQNRKRHKMETSDPNSRGRGRTVETHGGGIAVLRALWELINLERPTQVASPEHNCDTYGKCNA